MRVVSKVDYFKGLLQSTMQSVTESADAWMRFLTVSARFYKYRFADQLLIYAQQPTATACADVHIWQDVMHRQVRCGTQGIALLTEEPDGTHLKYVYDVSDTRTTPNSRPVRIWQLRRQHHAAVAKMLEQSYYIRTGDGIRAQLIQIADRLAQDTRSIDYGQYDLFDIGSQIKYNEGEEILFSRAVSASVGYVLLGRCALQPRGAFPEEHFAEIWHFCVPEKITALGAAVSTVSEQVLRQIETTVKALERSAAYGENNIRETGRDLSAGRRLHGTQHRTAAAAGEADWQVRQNAPQISAGASPGTVQLSAPDGGAGLAFGGDRRSGEEPFGRADAEAGRESGGNLAAQERRPDEVGRSDEQLQSTGGGDHLSGADLRLSDEEAEHGSSAGSASSVSQSENFRITDDRLGIGSASVKFRHNMEAIKTLHRIEAEHRTAMPEEQKILSRYVGWGGLAECLPSTTV